MLHVVRSCYLYGSLSAELVVSPNDTVVNVAPVVQGKLSFTIRPPLRQRNIHLCHGN